MKTILLFVFLTLTTVMGLKAQPCTPQGDQTTYGMNNTWLGYVYDGTNFNTYIGYVTEGNAGSANFDEGFGGDNVSYTTNGCNTTTETFSVRYKLSKTFANGTYQFTIGGDDGYRFSLDGGATWVINKWFDQSYASTTYFIALNGTYNMIIEFYENGGQNRITFNSQLACTGTENEAQYGTNNVWRGYLYSGMNFNTYKGFASEGSALNPNFNETFGGDNVTFSTSACGVQTEGFSARFRLTKTFANGTYILTVGGDDGYRLSLDGGATWAINKWNDQSYGITTITTTLNGTYSMVIEYYENGGQNRISFDLVTQSLPVKLKSFNAFAGSNESVKLKWVTATEQNTDRFDLQRSTNGAEYYNIGSVTSKSTNGNSSVDLNYEFIDTKPLPGQSFYRLVMRDKDGSYDYSGVARIEREDTKALYLFPTIIIDKKINIKSGKSARNIVVEMYDISGRKILEKRIGSIARWQQVSVPVSEANMKGNYVITVRDDQEYLARQIVMVR